MEERIIELEARIAYQDKTIEEVNEVLISQQAKIDALEGRIAAIMRHLQAQAVDPAGE